MFNLFILFCLMLDQSNAIAHASRLMPLANGEINRKNSKLSIDEQKQAIKIAQDQLIPYVQYLSRIAPNNPDVNNIVIMMLDSMHHKLRDCAVFEIDRLKDKNLAWVLVLKIAISENPTSTRVQAITIIPNLVDKNRKTVIKTFIENLRFDSDKLVQEAAETAFKKLSE